MKKRMYSFLVITFLAFFFTGCNDSKQTKTEEKENQPASDVKTDKDVSANSIELNAPDFANPELKQYYSVYTAYLKKVVTAIQNKDEAATMKIFSEEGKQFDNKNEMDQKAQSEEKQKFNAWLMQTMPYQKIIVESAYYKKFNEEYYKKVKEKFKEKGY